MDYTGKEDPEYNGEYSNSWYSYAWMTARKLNAQIHDIAQGGIALKDIIQDGFMNLKLSVWKQRGIKFIIIRSSEKRKNGIFAGYTPQVVVVAIGQNDNHPDDYMKEDYHSEKSINLRFVPE